MISAIHAVSRRGIRKDCRRHSPSPGAARLLSLRERIEVRAIRLFSARLAFREACDFERAKHTVLPHNEVMTFNRNIGMLLLAIYLILVGIVAIAGVAIPSVLTGVLALLAGIFILIGR
jgi:hypothetical protein